jgi:RNA polymerase sigma factor (sigma-70 family)
LSPEAALVITHRAANRTAGAAVGTDIATSPAHAVGGSTRREASDWIDLLYREHGRRVQAICTSLLRDRVEAEDAAQQTFLSAYRARLKGSDPRDSAAWLATIARNECWHRSRTAAPPAPETPVELPGPGADPPDEVIQRAELTAVWDAISDLPDSQREALLLREIRGLSYDQVAESLEMSRPSVRALLSRARQRLHAQVRRGLAALGGMPGLEPLMRLLATGGSDSAVSTAAKAAAVGVGATAILGGALAVPRLISDPPRPPEARHAPGRPSVTATTMHEARARLADAARAATAGAAASEDRSGRAGPREAGGGKDADPSIRPSHGPGTRGSTTDGPAASTAAGGASSRGPGGGDSATAHGSPSAGSSSGPGSPASSRDSGSGPGGSDSSGPGSGGSTSGGGDDHIASGGGPGPSSPVEEPASTSGSGSNSGPGGGSTSGTSGSNSGPGGGTTSGTSGSDSGPGGGTTSGTSGSNSGPGGGTTSGTSGSNSGPGGGTTSGTSGSGSSGSGSGISGSSGSGSSGSGISGGSGSGSSGSGSADRFVAP